jgi:hypoxanthine phosphoribosyltransferase
MGDYPKASSVRRLLPPEAIAARVAELGRQITADYQGKKLVVIVVLKGSFMFAADLVRAIRLPLRVEFLGVQSYGSGTQTTGAVQIIQDVTQPIEADDVLVVEDIVDTGLTVSYILSLLRARNPGSLRICALLDKPSRRRVEALADYVGFTIDDKFVVGYGLDYAQEYRNLDALCELLLPEPPAGG